MSLYAKLIWKPKLLITNANTDKLVDNYNVHSFVVFDLNLIYKESLLFIGRLWSRKQEKKQNEAISIEQWTTDYNNYKKNKK